MVRTETTYLSGRLVSIRTLLPFSNSLFMRMSNPVGKEAVESDSLAHSQDKSREASFQQRRPVRLGRIVLIILVLVSIYLATVAILFFLPQPPQCCAARYSIYFEDKTVGAVGTERPSWGGGLPCTDGRYCSVVNFSLTATSGLNTSLFGFKVLETNGSLASYAWVVVLWTSSHIVPLAMFNWSSGWSPSQGHSLPVTDLEGDGLTVVYSGSGLAGSGATLSVAPSGIETVYGSTSL